MADGASNRTVESSSRTSRTATVGRSAPANGARKRKASSPAETDFFGYRFHNPALLHLALTHSSLAYESHREGARDAGSDNERLEFIGDAVLGLATAEALYRRFPALSEGELTRMRASLVSRRNLAEVAQRIGLGPMLRLGRGEEHSGGQRKPALLANALEAVIAALYLDGGLAPAAEFVQRHVVNPAEAVLSAISQSEVPFSGAIGDFKSALQERLQANGAGQPKYVLADESGPDHQKRFRIEVRLAAPDGSSVRLAEAEGTTKKQAQQEAARLAYATLDASPNELLQHAAAPMVETPQQEASR
ncbi:MAG: ribonuclease III [Acidobacteriaceae bacterium]